MRNVLIFLLMALLSLGNAVTYGFESELWPGEGVPVFKAKKDIAVNMYDKPNGKVTKKYQFKSKEKIAYSASLYRTTKVGRVKVTSVTTLSGVNFGNIKYLSEKLYESDDVDEVDIKFKKDEVFDYLQYRAEGACLVSYKQNVIELEFCAWAAGGNDAFKLVREPKTEWWIKTTQGWLLIDEKTLDISREF